MGWHRLGLLLAPPRTGAWSRTHAALPTPLLRSDGDYDLYFSTRDDDNRASIGRAVMRVDDGLPAILSVDEKPVLTPGGLGAFDDSGVTVSCAVRDGARTLVYYTGWSRAVTVPFLLAVGLAIDEGDGRGFARVSEAPLLDRSVADPYLTASPFVLADGDSWRMWYVSATGWDRADGGARHRYLIKYAESQDGVSWLRDGAVAVGYRDNDEYALSRPWVLRCATGYEMWFSARGDAYRLAFARSPDGLAWQRCEPPGDLVPDDTGWGADMVAYPALIDEGAARFMLYNGAGYGRDGIGAARWDGDR